ncbi:MAG: flagellar biosynthetic protein FliO [Lachnospiraceae bacterium]
MRILITEFSAAAGIFRFIILFIIFIAVLVAAFYFTKWYANSGLIKKGNGNIKIIESYQLAPGKILYIVKIGSKFVSIMTSKDNIVKLTELSGDEIELQETELNNTSFKDVMGQMINNRKMKDDDKKNGK